MHATGTVYLQHGFSAIGWFYQPLAIQMAQQTNSVVVTPTIPSIPLPLGVYLNSPQMQQGVASLFLGSQTALNIGANPGQLPGHAAAGFHPVRTLRRRWPCRDCRRRLPRGPRGRHQPLWVW